MTQQPALALTATTRTIVGKKVANLRSQGFVPAVVYGHGQTNLNIQLNTAEFGKLYTQAGRGSLIQLTVDGQTPLTVVIQDLTTNHLSDLMEHVDFYVVRMDEEITTQATLEFVGEAPAVKTMGGTLVKNKDHVTITCLPGNLVKTITVDVSGLTDFTKSIKVADLSLPTGVKLSDQPEDIVVLVAAPRTDEELAALNATVTEDVSKVEGAVKPTAEVAEADKEKSANSKK